MHGDFIHTSQGHPICFKYLDQHMGIKQITSYQSIDYARLRDQLADRQVPNELYVQKTKEGRQDTRRKARLLLAEDTARRRETARQQEIDSLQAGPGPAEPSTPPPPPPASSKRLKALRQQPPGPQPVLRPLTFQGIQLAPFIGSFEVER